MFEADSQLKLLLLSILDIYKVFEHVDMVAALNNYPPYFAQMLGFWVTCGVKMMSLHHVYADSHLKLLPASILDITKCLSTLICCP